MEKYRKDEYNRRRNITPKIYRKGNMFMKKKVLIIAVVVVIAILGIAGANIAMNNKKSGAMVVQASTITKEDIESHIQSTGTIFSMDKRDVTSDVEEKIKKIYVQKGDKVENNQVLLELDATDIFYRIKDSKLRLSIENEGLKQLEEEGSKEFEIQLSNAKIRYEEAKNTYEINTKLYEKGIIANQEFEKSKDDKIGRAHV